jgi:ribosomal protein S18 acetylase RimI-like enzyme
VTGRIERLAELPAAGFTVLLGDSEQAGVPFLRRMANEWASGANRFDRPGEALFAARVGREMVAIGGLNVDPYAAGPRTGRVRHLYVLTCWRRQGIGEQLVRAIIEAAHGRFDRLRLRTMNPEASRLYERLGFTRRADVPDCSHVLELSERG